MHTHSDSHIHTYTFIHRENNTNTKSTISEQNATHIDNSCVHVYICTWGSSEDIFTNRWRNFVQRVNSAHSGFGPRWHLERCWGKHRWCRVDSTASAQQVKSRNKLFLALREMDTEYRKEIILTQTHDSRDLAEATNAKPTIHNKVPQVSAPMWREQLYRERWYGQYLRGSRNCSGREDGGGKRNSQSQTLARSFPKHTCSPPATLSLTQTKSHSHSHRYKHKQRHTYITQTLAQDPTAEHKYTHGKRKCGNIDEHELKKNYAQKYTLTFQFMHTSHNKQTSKQTHTKPQPQTPHIHTHIHRVQHQHQHRNPHRRSRHNDILHLEQEVQKPSKSSAVLGRADGTPPKNGITKHGCRTNTGGQVCG